ncbi:MAG: nicotinate-nucleotide adenylyltransferase [Spirochaetota bacterium]
MNTEHPKLGIFGGTFNPIHLGHLRLAEDVREEFGLDRIIFIPANIPPHKKIEDQVHPHHRLAMAKAAIADCSHFSLDDVEIRRGGKSYTIDTVNYIYRNYSFENRLYFVVGSDLIREIHTWKNINRLAEKVVFAVMIRESFPVDRENPVPTPMQGLDLKMVYFRRRKIDITSSEIRNRIKAGKSIHYLVTNKVFRYINENGLYV